MGNNVDLTKLLKGKEGTKLYCTLYPTKDGEKQNVELVSVIGKIIKVKSANPTALSDDTIGLMSVGGYCEGSECLLFPSKDCGDWGCFGTKYVIPTKDDTDTGVERILKSNGGHVVPPGFDYCSYESEVVFFIRNFTDEIDYAFKENEDDGIYECVITTGSDLRASVNADGGIFKVGDVVKDDEGLCALVVEKECPELLDMTWITAVKANDPDCGIVGFATDKDIERWNSRTLEPSRLHYSKKGRKLIHWFIEGDPVLMRCDSIEHSPSNCDEDHYTWFYSVFSHYRAGFFYNINNEQFKECIPYSEDTRRLIGTSYNVNHKDR